MSRKARDKQSVAGEEERTGLAGATKDKGEEQEESSGHDVLHRNACSNVKRPKGWTIDEGLIRTSRQVERVSLCEREGEREEAALPQSSGSQGERRGGKKSKRSGGKSSNIGGLLHNRWDAHQERSSVKFSFLPASLPLRVSLLPLSSSSSLRRCTSVLKASSQIALCIHDNQNDQSFK